jgi:hypothetical protein
VEVRDVEDAETVEIGWEPAHGQVPLHQLDPLRLEQRPGEPGRRDHRDGNENPEHLQPLELAAELGGSSPRAAVLRHVAGVAPLA